MVFLQLAFLAPSHAQDPLKRSPPLDNRVLESALEQVVWQLSQLCFICYDLSFLCKGLFVIFEKQDFYFHPYYVLPSPTTLSDWVRVLV